MGLKPFSSDRVFLDPNTEIKATTGNYKNEYNFADQFFPDLKHEVIKIYGNQNLTGFLEVNSMEEDLVADKTFWSEDARRRKVHLGVTKTGNTFTYTPGSGEIGHSIRLNDYIMVSDIAGEKIEFGLVTAVPTATTWIAKFEGAATWGVGAAALRVIAIGSEFKKGTEGKAKALTKEFSIYSTSPVIMKDQYEETGSNIPNVAWIHDPEGNPYWYIVEEQEAMFRFLDACEAQMILQSVYDASSELVTTDGYKGTQGLFPAIRDRGNNFEGLLASVSDMDDLVKRFDKINGQQYNTLFLSTEHTLTIDDTLAAINQYEAAAANYGIFGNKKDMVLELGFRGFQRGGYELIKQTWKFLKDPTMYNPDNFAPANAVNGIMVPLGQTAVRNTIEGNAVERIPFLTQMYKGKPGYSRKLVTNFHGSQLVPDATSTLDVYGINWLTERCLRPAGMIRWFMFEGASA